MDAELAQARLGRITASMFHVAVYGRPQARRTYLAQLRRERATGKPTGGGGSWTTNWGNTWEDEARRAVGLVLGRGKARIDPKPGFIEHPQYPEVGCSPDGMLVAGDYRAGIEVKCPATQANHREIKAYGWPVAKYECQVQGSMWVTGLADWIFASYDPRVRHGDLFLNVCGRDKRLIQRIEHGVLELREHLLEGTDPDG